jgi:hypothetical protein
MFFLDGSVGPARRAVKFAHQGRAVLQADLINPVLVTVERLQAAVAVKAQGFHRIQDGVRPKGTERLGFIDISHDTHPVTGQLRRLVPERP